MPSLSFPQKIGVEPFVVGSILHRFCAHFLEVELYLGGVLGHISVSDDPLEVVLLWDLDFLLINNPLVCVLVLFELGDELLLLLIVDHEHPLLHALELFKDLVH